MVGASIVAALVRAAILLVRPVLIIQRKDQIPNFLLDSVQNRQMRGATQVPVCFQPFTLTSISPAPKFLAINIIISFVVGLVIINLWVAYSITVLHRHCAIFAPCNSGIVLVVLIL